MDRDDLRTALSVWLTLALDTRNDGVRDSDLLRLRDWIDGGCTGDMPEPKMHDTTATLGLRVTESIRVFFETRDWSPAQFRAALVEARIR